MHEYSNVVSLIGPDVMAYMQPTSPENDNDNNADDGADNGANGDDKNVIDGGDTGDNDHNNGGENGGDDNEVDDGEYESFFALGCTLHTRPDALSNRLLMVEVKTGKLLVPSSPFSTPPPPRLGTIFGDTCLYNVYIRIYTCLCSLHSSRF